MAKNNKTKYAILGLLHFKPMSGYDIKKYADRSLSFFWSENFGHIYPVLKQLELEGLVTSRKESTDHKPQRIVFSVTENGVKALHEWMTLDTMDYPTVRDELLLRVFFGETVSGDQMTHFLEKQKEVYTEKLSMVKSVEGAVAKMITDSEIEFPGFKFWRMTMEYGHDIFELRKNWCQKVIDMIKE